MTVPADVQKRVTEKLQEGIRLLNNHYGKQLKMPAISYKLRGTTAGRANYEKWIVKFNEALLLQDVDRFVARTVPHELAHLGVDAIYPEAHRNRGTRVTRRGKIVRVKREVHGPRWQELMAVLGVQDSTRCHSYDTTQVRSKKAQYHYRCAGCQKVIPVGPRVHADLVKKPDSRSHKGCRGHRLHLVGHTPAQKAPAYAAAAAPKAAKAPRPGTQLAKAYGLYKAWQHRYDRQGMIAVFRNELGMSTAGASTYVYQCQKLYQQGVI